MRYALVALAIATLSVAACSKSEQSDAGENAKAAAAKIGEATKEVATSPEMKAVGNDIKQGAAEAGAVAKDAFATAGAELKEGADAKIDAAAADAKK